MIQDFMNGGASVEETLELWASGLRAAKNRIVPLFTQKRVAASACAFLDVLIGNEPRKTGWMRAEAAGDPGPWRQQALLGRQYTGSAGKITNCQIGVFGAYVSERGHAFIDRALYLPKDWTSKPERMKRAHVPDDVVFATKPALASKMIERCLNACAPFSWVAADSVYGVGDVERTLRRAGIGYVLGVKGNHWFRSWATEPLIAGEAKDIVAGLPDQAWRRLSAGHGTKGERLYDWTRQGTVLHAVARPGT